MSDVPLLLRQTLFNLTALRRSARALIFTVIMPVFLLVLFNSIIGDRNPTTRLNGDRVDIRAYFTAGIIAYSIMLSGFSSIVISITTAREAGLLKRYRGTPMPSWVFLGAQILASVAQIVVMVVVLLAIGRIGYDVPIPSGGFAGLVVYTFVGTASMCALGLAITRFTPTVEAAGAIGPFSAVLLAFISGVFVTASSLPGWLVDVGRVFPLAHLAEGLQRSLALGRGIELGNLAVIGVWGIVGLAIARRGFRWEPIGAGVGA